VSDDNPDVVDLDRRRRIDELLNELGTLLGADADEFADNPAAYLRRIQSDTQTGDGMSQKQLSIRLPEDLLDRAEKLRPVLQENDDKLAALGKLSRADVLRLCLLKGIESYEDEYDVDPQQVDISELEGGDD
jgi:hypothetical protein